MRIEVALREQETDVDTVEVVLVLRGCRRELALPAQDLARLLDRLTSGEHGAVIDAVGLSIV